MEILYINPLNGQKNLQETENTPETSLKTPQKLNVDLSGHSVELVGHSRVKFCLRHSTYEVCFVSIDMFIWVKPPNADICQHCGMNSSRWSRYVCKKLTLDSYVDAKDSACGPIQPILIEKCECQGIVSSMFHYQQMIYLMKIVFHLTSFYK